METHPTTRLKAYILSPAAQADLSQIWNYSARNWGAARANRYVLDIRHACEALANGSRRGRPIDDIRPGYRKLGVASHLLFYRITDAGMIDIIRILHQRMDAASRLRD